MNFSEALIEMKNGRKVARSHWLHRAIPTCVCLPMPLKPYAPHFVRMKSVDSVIQLQKTFLTEYFDFIHDDLLSDDWVLVNVDTVNWVFTELNEFTYSE